MITTVHFQLGNYFIYSNNSTPMPCTEAITLFSAYRPLCGGGEKYGAQRRTKLKALVEL